MAHPVGNFNPRDNGRFGKGKQYSDEIEINPSQLKDFLQKQRDIARSEKEKKQAEKQNPNDKPEYTIEFSEDGFDIIHRHYKDRQEYEVYKNGKLLDIVESTNELNELINNYKK